MSKTKRKKIISSSNSSKEVGNRQKPDPAKFDRMLLPIDFTYLGRILNATYPNNLGIVYVRYRTLFCNRKTWWIRESIKPPVIKLWTNVENEVFGFGFNHFAPRSSQSDPIIYDKLVISKYAMSGNHLDRIRDFLSHHENFQFQSRRRYLLEVEFPSQLREAKIEKVRFQNMLAEKKRLRDKAFEEKIRKQSIPSERSFSTFSGEIEDYIKKVEGYSDEEQLTTTEISNPSVPLVYTDKTSWYRRRPPNYKSDRFPYKVRRASYTGSKFTFDAKIVTPNNYYTYDVTASGFGDGDPMRFGIFTSTFSRCGVPFQWDHSIPTPDTAHIEWSDDLNPYNQLRIADELKTRALVKFSKRMKMRSDDDHNSNFSITIGEFGLMLFANPKKLGAEILRFTEYLMKKLYYNIKTAVKRIYLDISKVRYSRMYDPSRDALVVVRLKDYWQKALNSPELSDISIAGALEILQVAVSVDLMNKFALQPLLQDLYTLVGLYRFGLADFRLLDDDIQLSTLTKADQAKVLSYFKPKRYIKITKTFSSYDGKLIIPENDADIFYCDINRNYDVKSLYWQQSYRCKANVELKNSRADLSTYASLDPRKIAWELFPCSFIVNWFYNIGGYLEARSLFEIDQGYTISNFQESKCTSNLIHFTETLSASGKFEGEWTGFYNHKAINRFEFLEYERSPVLESPEIPNIHWSPDFGFAMFKREKITIIGEVVFTFLSGPLMKIAKGTHSLF